MTKSTSRSAHENGSRLYAPSAVAHMLESEGPELEEKKKGTYW